MPPARLKIPRNLARLWLMSLPVGAVAGAAASMVDAILVVLTVGFWEVSWRPSFFVAYAVVGVSGSILWTAVTAWRRLRPRIIETATAAFAGVYVVPLCERLLDVATPGVPNPVAWLAALAASLGYVSWVWLLRRLIGPEGAWFGTLLAALSLAAGLDVNRNLAAATLDLETLGLDLAIVATTLALAFTRRSLGPRGTAGVCLVVALAAAGLGIGLMREALSLPEPPGGTPDETHPNLVFIVIDTLRQDVFHDVVHQTVEGQEFRDSLEDAAWFSNAIAASSWTLPSVGSILTGRYPPEHGVRRFASANWKAGRLSEAVPTLTEGLSRHGYQTAAIVANPILMPSTGLSRGFHHFEVLRSSTLRMPFLTAIERLGFFDQDNIPAALVLRRLEARLPHFAKERPLFLWLHLMDPHRPLRHVPNLTPDEAGEDLPELDRLYRDAVRGALLQVTRMLESLRSHLDWQQTAVVFLSDHGEMLPSDGHQALDEKLRPHSYGHGHTLYDELQRVPLIIRPPGGLRDRRQVEFLASHTDIHDTVCDLLGLDLPRIGGDRISLAPWLGSDPPTESPERERVLMTLAAHGRNPEQRGVRSSNLKLIHYPRGERPPELYDLETDPGEKHNLAEERADLLFRLTRALRRSWSKLAPSPTTRPVEYDEETLRRLRALGYVD